MSTYVFGDIQGCYDELQALLSLIKFNKSNDQLCFLGDLINRGNKNLDTLKFMMSLPNIRVVLGNHDLHFLAVATGTQNISKKDTFRDMLDSSELNEIITWMRQQSLIIYLQEFDSTLVHAGIPPNWSIKEAIKYAHEVEAILKSHTHLDFFKNMYGNEPSIWTDELLSWNRMRVITNSLTRLRYCKLSGEMEFKHKTKIQPKGYQPWFEFDRSESGRILFGHWAALEGVTGKKKILALDTGCVWGRKLTCYRLEDQQYFSVAATNN